MTRLWIVLIAVLALMPTLLAMRPVDDVLLKAAFKGDLGEGNTQIKKEADVNAANTVGFTPLLVATKKGDREIVSLLLGHGADMTQATTINRMTAMHVAALHGHREIVALLLKHGADKSVMATTGHQPVDFARQQGHSALVPLLES
ncbi:MAG: ankyrin repeat domain-containing protein [Nitrospiraceae bacterium]|nr:ankyrin repeat domain-containing protein [Nitrospiraceae bacterium]